MIDHARLIYGSDVRESLKTLAPSSVHMVATSPPYWGVRSYLDSSDPLKPFELGSEDSLEAYIGNLVSVFREIKRVLRKDGTVWLNIGELYYGGGRAGKNPEYWKKHTSFGKVDPVVSVGAFGKPVAIPEGMKSKDMAMAPHRVAMALQEDGWYLRAACPWIKRSCLPESCTDRPSTGIEYIFLLAHPDSGGKYYYDINGIRSSDAKGTGTRQRRTSDWFMESIQAISKGEDVLLQNEEGDPLAFVVNTVPYREAHFACWPPNLVLPMILSSTSEKGCCSTCGSQWVRGKNEWVKPCACDSETVPSTVLDPFSGSGTTGMVALQNERKYVGLDLNAAYLPLAEARIKSGAPNLTVEGSVLDLFGEC